MSLYFRLVLKLLELKTSCSKQVAEIAFEGGHENMTEFWGVLVRVLEVLKL